MSNILLSEVGWDEGFAIPVANAENKGLEDELQMKQNQKLQLENKLGGYKDRIQAMAEHLTNVRQELSQTQALCKAREKETESEMHFKALAEREVGRLRQEIAQLDNELGALREKKNAQENNIFKATQKLEELKSQLNWDQQTLDAWLEESAHKDEDTMAIIKYAQQDESRIRELTLLIEKMTLEANQKHKALDNELTETISAQIGLDKTAENFRQAHLERQELIHQWENTIEQMKKRDSEMQQCSMLLTQVNQDIRERNGVIKEKKAFLESETENNKEYEKKIAMADRQAAKLRREFQEQESNRTRLQDELESLKGTVDRAATDVESMRSQLANMKKDIQDKNNKVKGAKLHNTALEEKLKTVTETTLSVEERAAQMEQVLKEEEQTIKDMDAQLHRHREVLFRESQEVQALRLKEKDSMAVLSGSRVALSNLDSRLSKLDQNSLKQQEIIYNQDFQIQLLERKMLRLRGEVNTEEKQVLEKKAQKLAHRLEEKKRTATMLTTQLKKLQDDIRCVRKEAEKTGAEKSDLTTKIEELHLFNHISDKELKKLRLKKQDTMVEDNILKLEIKRLRDLLYNKADSVLSLEKRRLQLQTAMREREEEIKAHREMLNKQVKITDQERQGLSAEVHERLSKVDKMRKRYEIMTVSMAAPEGEEEKSQAYYVIKAAQEKEELQREGDDLDGKIRKMEKEIRALENTLHVVNSRNTTYRKSFNKVTESSEEYQEKLKLDEQKRAAEEKYKYKRRQIRELQEDIQGMNNTLDNLLQEEAIQNVRTEETQSHIMSLNRELVSQQEKLHRVTKQCSKLTKEIRSAKKTKEETFEERDIELRELKDFNKNINKMLLVAMEEQPDLRSALHMYFVQANLPLPSPASTPASRQSSKTNSARSSVSLRSAGSSASSSPRAASVQSPPVKTLELGLGLSVTSPPLTSPRDSHPPSSTSSSSGSKHQSP
ncbi:coiled-coil domain-containing protein 39 [Oncorhynchus tshawytscha]|uniref:Coiled-coil domain-containing protein 39 n=1 Tax=Oncorhynchus tshawytscha TaxID=74940 RepID=A0A8C8J9W3_ONCTS|nr:coiled-coil domain-containing protein 39 [Oncorhynchus tshawytscha]